MILALEVNQPVRHRFSQPRREVNGIEAEVARDHSLVRVLDLFGLIYRTEALGPIGKLVHFSP